MKVSSTLPVMSLVAGIAFSFNAIAEDEKPWTATVGLSYRDANFNLPSNKYSNDSWSTNLGLMRRLDDRTWLGGSIAYNNGNSNYKSFAGEADIDTTSMSAYIIRNLAWGLYGNASIGYGKSQIDTNISSLRYDTDADFKTATIGLTQYLPFTVNLMGSINANYTHVSSDIDKFVTNLGAAVPSSDSTLNYITLGGSLTYRVDKWSPFVNLHWNKASREFLTGTGDEDYFSYGFGTRYTISPETNIGLTLGSVFDKRYANEASAGISLSHQF